VNTATVNFPAETASATIPRQAAKPLSDKQSEPDHRQLRIDKVGVRGLRFPVQVCDKNTHALQNTVATVGLFVDLPEEFKGTHMSRFVEVLNAHGGVIHVASIPEMLEALQKKLHAQNAHLEMEFPYFIVKKAPVSGKEGVVDYTVRFEAAMSGREFDFLLTVKCNVTTLCPCSKAISKYGAHNQRGEVTVQVRSEKILWIEDLIAQIEASGSSEMYSLLKREDEKAVTERAYENPVFVEDLVRNVALRLNAQSEITWYRVEAENYESIHNHNAYACIGKG
jgi:GTP cyclohydrolase I